MSFCQYLLGYAHWANPVTLAAKSHRGNFFQDRIASTAKGRCSSRAQGMCSNNSKLASTNPEKTEGWSGTLARYKGSNFPKSCWQVANSVLPFVALWYLMYLSSFWSYGLTLLLAVPAAGFVVRIFVIQHDCGHHSFFSHRRANDILGFLCGVVTATPYHSWRRAHARHHVTSGNLEHRGHGDVATLTVREYLARSGWHRLRYRIYRHPLIMYLLSASFQFMIGQRFTLGIPRSWRRERNSVYFTNLAIVAVLGLASVTIGLPTFLLIELPVMVLASAAGSWLFYVQHQYEDAYWQPNRSWDFTDSALAGSSYYHLPRVLQWFTGNIGFHHIHHLNSRIPNYNLAACHAAEPQLREVVTLGLWQSLRCASLKLWDEDRQRLVTFASAHSGSSIAGGMLDRRRVGDRE
jgi:omega-6 fatty acid desaturase (delta-12 desaturase)